MHCMKYYRIDEVFKGHKFLFVVQERRNGVFENSGYF